MIAALFLSVALTVTPQPTPVEVFWEMPTPDGGWSAEPTSSTATWPQTVADPNALTCGKWYQADVYPSQEVADGLTADGILTNGEDHSTVVSWRFVYGGDCVPEPTPEPTPDPVPTPEPEQPVFVPEPETPAMTIAAPELPPTGPNDVEQRELRRLAIVGSWFVLMGLGFGVIVSALKRRARAKNPYFRGRNS